MASSTIHRVLLNRSKTPAVVSFPPNTSSFDHVALLFGWLGSTPKIMSKYSPIYNTMGVPTFSVSCENHITTLRRWELDGFVEDVKDCLETFSLDQKPIILHCFSNNGSLVYERIINSNTHPTIKQKLKYLVFDSSPAEITIKSTTNAFQLGDGGTSFGYWTGFGVMVGWQKWFHNAFTTTEIENSTHLPSLYLYSQEDKVTNHEFIDHVVEKKREVGTIVEKVKFVGSAHCSHFIENSSLYTTSIQQFIKSQNQLSSNLSQESKL